MHWSYGAVVRRALVVGAVVGVLLAAYVYLIVEPTIEAAVRLEEAARATGAEHDDETMFTREQQRAGGMAASLLYALVAAVVFGTAYAALRHRVTAATELARTLWLAGVGFVALALVPALKYPPVPPGAASAGDAGRRTVLYVACLVAGVLVAVLITRLSGALRSRLTDPARLLTVAGAAVAGYALLLVALPPVSETADALPAGLVWDFRVRSLGGLALLWAGLGLGLGWLLDRAEGTDERSALAVDP